MSLKRTAPRHTHLSSHPAHRDDYLDGYYLQGSTQIDGLRHRRADDIGFYNGTPDDRIREGTPDLGIQEWAENPIVGRGVLVDLDGLPQRPGKPHRPCRRRTPRPRPDPGGHGPESLRLRPGDILMLHTGWCEWFLALTPEEKQRTRDSRRATGVAQSRGLRRLGLGQPVRSDRRRQFCPRMPARRTRKPLPATPPRTTTA